MVVEVSEVIEAALALSIRDREAIVRQVAISLDHDKESSEQTIAATWDAEIANRVDEIFNHQVQGIPWEQVKAEADQVVAATR